MKQSRNDRQPTLIDFEPVGIARRSARPARGANVRDAAPEMIKRSPNADLVGRTFFDGTSHVRVKGLSATNPADVVVEREHDGHAWTIHAGIVRLVVGRASRKRAA